MKQEKLQQRETDYETNRGKRGGVCGLKYQKSKSKKCQEHPKYIQPSLEIPKELPMGSLS